MGRAADQSAVEAGQGAHRRRRQVVLPQVNAVGVGRNRQVGVIVDDQQRLVRPGQGPQGERQPILLQHRHRLFAKLDHGRATIEGGFDDPGGLDLVPAITRDHVEAHACQDLPSLLGQVHINIPPGVECSRARSLRRFQP